VSYGGVDSSPHGLVSEFARMPEPRLTVALPTCNGACHLAAALRSILDQETSGVAFDLLVCDDQSDDATREIVPEIAGNRARLVVNPNRLGLAGNWNQCVAQSRTPLVAIVHQDDILLPGHLARVLAAWDGLQPHGPPGMVVAAATAIDDAGHPLPRNVVDPGTFPLEDVVTRFSPDALGGVPDALPAYFRPGGFVRALVTENPVRCSGVVLSREAHQAVGGFDPSYRYAVDWDFWLRIARRFAVAWIVEPPGVAFRWHAASETHRFKTSMTDLQEQERLLADVIRQDRPSRSLQRQAHRRLARAYLNRAYDAACAGDRRLERSALGRALRLDPLTAARLLADPRLLGRLIRGRRATPPVSDPH
jgi:glycosyltransferase involved in cell wall biosynthesis